MNILGKDYFTRKEAAHYLCVKTDELDRCVRENHIPSIKWAGRQIFRRSDCQRAVEAMWRRLESLAEATSWTGMTRKDGGIVTVSDVLTARRGKRRKDFAGLCN